MSHQILASRVASGCLAACCLFTASWAAAAPPAALLPATTKGMVGVRDIHQLESNWERTQLGELVNDPEMKPFVEDVERQLRSRLMETRLRLGIQLSQLSDVGTGALAIANTQPGSQKQAHALLLVVAVQGKEAAAQALIHRAAEKLGGGQAIQLGAVQGLKARVAGASGQQGHDVIYCIQHGHLFACDSVDGVREAVTAAGGGDSLAKDAAFQTVMKQTKSPAGSSDIQWYVDLFGYAQVCQAISGGEGKIAKLLASQGFDSVKSAGGQIQLATAEHELLHQTFVYAPAGTSKLQAAAKLLAFVNSAETSQPLAWIPGSVANHLQLKFNFQDAFQGLKPIVNAVAEDDVFDSMLENIANEPNGPRVDIRREVLPYVGSRVTILSDRVPPISAESERLLAAVEVRNEDAIRKALNRWLQTEPRMRSVHYRGHLIWEYVPEEIPANDGLALDIEGADGFGFDSDEGGFGFEDAQPASAPATTPEQLLPKIAVTIARGHVLVSTHIDYLKMTLTREANGQLDTQNDFARVKQALEKLGGGHDTVHFFTRLDAALEVSYELVRTGQIAESPSLLGTAMRLLNNSGTPQTQQLDASNLPPFANVSNYLGPHGLYLQQRELGWLMTGCLLKK